jgi:hypothetical protein
MVSTERRWTRTGEGIRNNATRSRCRRSVHGQVILNSENNVFFSQPVSNYSPSIFGYIYQLQLFVFVPLPTQFNFEGFSICIKCCTTPAFVTTCILQPILQYLFDSGELLSSVFCALSAVLLSMLCCRGRIVRPGSRSDTFHCCIMAITVATTR